VSRYLIVLEKTEDGYSAYAPDIPGVAGVGSDVQDTMENMREGLELYIEEALSAGDPIPPPSATRAEYLDIEVPSTVSAS
jgi:predicted RNase H-like HicB family nuclease